MSHETVSFQYCLISSTRNKFIHHQTLYIGCLKIQNYQHLFHKKLPKTNSNLCRLSFSVSCPHRNTHICLTLVLFSGDLIWVNLF